MAALIRAASAAAPKLGQESYEKTGLGGSKQEVLVKKK